MAQRKVNCEVYTDRGIVGKDGAEGKSAYQQAVEGGYQGTEEEFEQALASDIATVANNVTNINVVGNNIENVNTAVDNMSAIIAAPTAATQAAASASQAATSATNAQTSETNAATSASNAAASATNASASATIATTKASEATSSATSASASANSASESATSASTSSTNAQTWAEGADSAVTPLGGNHSAKGWASIAKQYAESIGAALKYKGSVSTYSALPSTGQEIGDTWNVLDTGDNYAWTGTEWDKLSGTVDLSAYRTSADQDIIDATKATKAELSRYLPLTGGTINGELKVVGPKSTIKTYSGDKTSGYTYLKLKAEDGNQAAIILTNNAGETCFRQSGKNTEIINLTYNKSLMISSALTFDNNKVLDASDKAVANGVASLDANTKVPVAQIPDLSSTYATIANTVSDVVAGSTADKINVTKNGSTSTITINNVANATKASQVVTEPGSVNVARYVYFEDSSTTGRINYDSDFKYNPSTNVLTVGSITGNAATASRATADASGNTISTTYVKLSSLATVATSGMYSDLTGTPSAATANTLGLVKPDGNTITVTEDGTISATGGSGSGDTIGLSIGDVVYSYSSLSSENPGKLPLFTGETIASANTIYPEFYNWVSAHTELQCTSTEYESALTTYGECAKYVIGGGSLRLPLIKNYIKAANPSEGIKNIEAGLPNVTGTFGGLSHSTPVGAFTIEEVLGSLQGASSGGGVVKEGFDASLSSPIYGKSSTVTPASTTLYPWVVAYTAAIPASTAQAAEFQQGLSGKADTNLGNVPSNYDYVVDSYSDDSGNWYRVYKSGWLEQGGVATSDNVTLLKPMANANYSVYMSQSYNAGSYSAYSAQPYNRTTTSFSYFQYQGNFNAFWYVCGKGAN